MAIKKYAILHNVRGEQVPPEWAAKLGLGAVHSDTRYEVFFKLLNELRRKKASYERFMETVNRLQKVSVTNPNFTEDDLYDEHGLPK